MLENLNQTGYKKWEYLAILIYTHIYVHLYIHICKYMYDGQQDFVSSDFCGIIDTFFEGDPISLVSLV